MKLDSEKTREELLLEVASLRSKMEDLEANGVHSLRLADTFIESEKYFRSLMENATDGVAIISIEGIIIYESASIERILGYPASDLLGYALFDFVHPSDFDKISNTFDKLLRDPETIHTIELRFLHKDRSWHTLECICKNQIEDISISGIVMNFRDITERILSTERILNSESQFRSLTENIPVAIFIYYDYIAIYCNSMAETITGYTKKELLGMSILNLIHPDFREIVKNNIDNRLSGRYAPIRYEFKISRKDDKSRWIDFSAATINFNSKMSILGSCFDITNHKELEKALLESREHIAVTLHSIADGVISTDELGNIVLLNREAERCTGWTYSDAFGRPLNEILRIANDQPGENETNPFFMVLKDKNKILLDKYILVSKNGDEIHIEGSCAPICDNLGYITGIVIAFRDITDKIRMENEIRRSHKLESIGVLTGGIAHDFNNLLTIILGNVILAKMYAKRGDKVSEKLTESERAALKAKELTKKLLNFSTIGTPVKKFESIEKTIRDSVRLALISSSIDVEFNIPDDLWKIKFDQGQIHQVFHNLIINAKNAMKKDNKVIISAENIELRKDNIHSLPRGKFIRISVKDHGPGISEENLKKIFDPYFTTNEKDSYKGRGLGLSICYSIIKNHDGHITAESKLNEGTIFYIYLPS